MKNKLLAVLGVILVLVWIRALTVRPGRSARTKTSAASPAPVAAASGSRTTSDLQVAAAPVAEGWGESPFIADRNRPRETAGSGKEYVLNGILWDPKSPSALVNNQVVSTGDRLDGWEVTEIQKNKVVLSNGSQTRTLSAD